MRFLPRNYSDPKTQIKAVSESAVSIGIADPVLTTPGREVEHLVIPKVLAEAVRSSVKYIKRDGDRNIYVDFGVPTMANDKTFAKAFAETSKAKEAGTEITDEQRKRISKALLKKKVAVSNRVVAREGQVFTEPAKAFGKQLIERIRGFQ